MTMKTLLATAALVASLGAGMAQAQTTAPVGGPDAKGNAPLKHVHTVNDGSARPGANSFTQGQARQHILNSGYTDVSGLTKGSDGVWRGQATHNGQSVSVAMDFKGNVTEAATGGGSAPMAAEAAPAAATGAQTTTTTTTRSSSSSSSTGGMHHHVHHRHRHHHCAQPGPDGTACSGVATLQNGVSDKETRAMQDGAHP